MTRPRVSLDHLQRRHEALPRRSSKHRSLQRSLRGAAAGGFGAMADGLQCWMKLKMKAWVLCAHPVSLLPRGQKVALLCRINKMKQKQRWIMREVNLLHQQSSSQDQDNLKLVWHSV